MKWFDKNSIVFSRPQRIAVLASAPQDPQHSSAALFSGYASVTAAWTDNQQKELLDLLGQPIVLYVLSDLGASSIILHPTPKAHEFDPTPDNFFGRR